jgi:hypothetical protein
LTHGVFLALLPGGSRLAVAAGHVKAYSQPMFTLSVLISS